MSESVATLSAKLERGTLPERVAAAEQLARLGTQAQVAIVTLVRATADDNEDVRSWANTALEECGPPRSADLPALVDLLDHASLDVAHSAALLLGRLGGDGADAVEALTRALGHHHELVVRERAAWALGKIGVGSPPVCDALRQAVDAGPPRLARLAATALEQVSA